MQEVIEKRTATSKTYSLGSGKYQTEYFSYPVHYLAEDGKTWLEVDTRIVEVKGWEFTEGVMAGVFKTYFGDVTSDNFHLYSVTDEGGEKWINFKLKGATPKETSTIENTHRFVECFEGVDVEYVVFPELVKENIWINRSTNIREFVFTIKSGGVSLVKNEEDDLSVVSIIDGKTLWVIDTPYLEDAEGRRSYGVLYELGNDGEYETLTVRVTDEIFMQEAVYPIVIDPSLVAQDYASFYVFSRNAYNSTTQTTMGAQWTSTGDNPFYRYCAIQPKFFEEMRVSLSNGGIVINSATLELYLVSFGNGAGGITAHHINNPWTPATQPSAGSVYANVSTSLGFKSIDIGKMVQENPSNFNGVAFGYTSTTGYGSFYFASPNYADVTRRPKITLQYLMRPVIGFHDGTAGNGRYYSDGYDQIFKLLDFGTLTAGQASNPQKLFVQNLAGFEVTNLRVFVTPADFPENTDIELSQFNSPFIPEHVLRFNGTFASDEQSQFYIRVVTQEDTMVGGDFNIYAKADPL
ncbi:hypothetical protein [Paenibacillus sp. NPDC057967]|uniref:hypothetical protein n=1 Tax=Paenibacillus sp. NPDC057967 TaxID=3346293 RepID=UPI0036DE6746